MDTLAIVLRVILSLAVVFGLLWVCHRIASRNQRTSGGSRDSITVVARQGLAQKAAAVLIDSGDKRYLLGVSEGGVALLDSMPIPGPEQRQADEFAAVLDTVRTAEGLVGHRQSGGLWVPMSAQTHAPAPVGTRQVDVDAAAGDESDHADAVSAPGLLEQLRGGLGRRGTWKAAARQVLKGRAA